MRTLALFLLCGLLCLVAPSLCVAKPGAPSTPVTVTIPFTNPPHSRLMIVQARLNDKLTGNFVIDTGAPVSVLSESMAQKLGLGFVRGATAAGGLKVDIGLDRYGEPDSLAELASLRMSNLVINHASLLVVQLGDSPFFNPGRSRLAQRIDGVIGLDMLHGHPFLVDDQKQQITLWVRVRLSASDLDTAGLSGAGTIPLKELNSGHYAVSAKIENGGRAQTDDLVIDTGSEFTQIAPRLASDLALNPVPLPAGLALKSEIFYGQFPNSLALADSLQAGDLVIPHALVGYSGPLSKKLPSVLGIDQLAGYRLLFDFPDKKIYFTKEAETARTGSLVEATVPYAPAAGGEPLIVVTLGGASATLLVDTALPYSRISDTLAAKLGLPLQPVSDPQGNPLLLGGKAVKNIVVPRVQIGPLAMVNSQFLVLDSAAVAPALGQAVDGVLGADFLATAEPLIDFGRHEIRFLAPGPLQDADLKALGLTEAVDLPITETRSLPAQITSGRITVEEPLAISTGSSVTTLPDSVEKALNSHSHSPLSISNFSLCGLDLGPETVSYAADSQVGAGVGVGVDLLSSFLVLVDYQNNRVYLALTKDSNASQQTADTGARP